MKSIFASKTFWLAVVQGLAGVMLVVKTTYPTLGWVGVVLAVLQIVNRFYTDQAVYLTGQK